MQQRAVNGIDDAACMRETGLISNVISIYEAFRKCFSCCRLPLPSPPHRFFYYFFFLTLQCHYYFTAERAREMFSLDMRWSKMGNPASCAYRTQALCENRGGRPGLPVSNKPDGFCGRKAIPKRNCAYVQLHTREKYCCVRTRVLVFMTFALSPSHSLYPCLFYLQIVWE